MVNVHNHVTREYSGIVLDRMIHLPNGGRMGDLPEHLQHASFVRKGDKNTGGPNMRLLRLELDKPSLTVTAYIFNKFVHPTENRYITPREAACLQDFPIDYKFCGTLGQVQQQIGNAVPVKLSKAIAEEVAKYFERNNSTGKKKIASYFVGAGGFDLGFEKVTNNNVKFETIFSTDIKEHVEETIKENRPRWGFLREDIKQLEPEKVKKIIGGKPDLIIGGPPCQPFSNCGKQKATNDPLGVLYKNYVEHVEYLSPKIVIMENVYGLAQVKSANMVSEIYAAFKKIGYEVTHKELLSADYGTPQMRRRLFFIAAKDLENFEFPEPTHCELKNLFGLPQYNGAGRSFMELPDPQYRT